MGLFDGIERAVKGISAGTAVSPGKVEEFPRTLNEDDFMGTTSVAVLTGKYNVIGTYTVLAQQEYFWGQMGPAQPDNQGYLYVALRTTGTKLTGTPVEGKIRLTAYDANDRLMGVVFEEHTSVLRGSKTDRKLKMPLPIHRIPLAFKDCYLAVEFRPEAAGTISYTASEMLLPVTNRWVRQ